MIFVILVVFYLIAPISGAVYGYRVATERKLEGVEWLACVTWRTLLFLFLSFLAASLIIPSFLPFRSARNDVAAAAACKAYAEAQEIYFRTDYNNDGVHEYAQHLSGPESLLTNGSTEIALVDRAFAAADGNAAKLQPKAGYLFRILTAQGMNATGGAMSYIENGRMTKGYAMLAYPAEYGATGYTSFMISKAGTIYSADLGPNSTQVAKSMTEFDPLSPTWTLME